MRAPRAASRPFTGRVCLLAMALVMSAPALAVGQTAAAPGGSTSQYDTINPPRAYGPPGGARRAMNGSQLAGPRGGGGMMGQQSPMAGAQPPAGGPRQQLEQRIRIRFEQIVRRRLQLTDDQLTRLRQTNRRFAPQRQALAAHERTIRQAIRAELRPGVATDEQRVGVLMDSLFVLQHQRLDMLQSEQRELSTFLTPSQRVRYYALQEQLQRRVQAMRQAQQRALQGPAGAGAVPPGP
jgi:periplasmic protein CpxP/Spy